MVTTDAAHEFWTGNDLTANHRDLAKEYERNIDIKHPRGASCFCGPSCPWAATKVEYPSYTGPRVTSL